MNIIIIHYKPLQERKRYYEESKFFLESNLSFITSDDREELKWSFSEQLYIWQKELWKQNVQSILPIVLFNSGMAATIDKNNKLQLPRWAEPRILKESEISLIYKHHTALLMASQNKEPTFILEDDALLKKDTQSRVASIIAEFKASNLDYLDLAGGCNLPLQPNENISSTGITYLKVPRSRTTAGYLISPSAALKIASSLFPLSLPLDWSFQATFLHHRFKVAWCIPELFIHGSQEFYTSSIQ